PAGTAAQRAKQALEARTPAEAERGPLTAQARAANITLMHADGQALPERFLTQDWARHYGAPPCLFVTARCEALVIDLDGDGTPEILLFSLPTGPGVAFKAQANGSWGVLGSVSHCSGNREGLRSGPIVLAEPRFKEIEVGRDRLRIIPSCSEEGQR